MTDSDPGTTFANREARTDPGRVLYRLTRTNPPTASDFRSNKEKGRPPTGLELAQPRLHEGVSLWDSKAEAIARAFRPCWIAELSIPADVDYEQTTDNVHHFTVWASAEQLLSFVQKVEPTHG